MIIDRNVDCLNFAEAYVGRISLENRTLVVPVSNLYILEGGTSELLNENVGNVIQFAYVVFYDIDGITWDYDKSRLLDESKRTCIGGDCIDSSGYTEFWFEHSGGLVCTHENAVLAIREESYSNLELADLGVTSKLESVPPLKLLTRK